MRQIINKIRPIVLVGILWCIFSGELKAQSTVPFVNQVITATSGTQVVKARSMIVFGPGFSYTPSSGTLTTQIENPLTSGTVSYANSQPEPSSTAISTSYKPGTLPGMVDISQVGSAGYSIPIELPKGVDGFQPSLAISYSSMAGDGIMGKGWNIAGLGAITRVPTSYYYNGMVDGVDFDSNDRYTLNGQRMILISGSEGVDGSEYRLEQDQSVKITKNSGFYTVKTADGTTYEYGGTYDSRVAGDYANTLSWNVSKITNNYGQVINIGYDQSSGWAYPALITYGVSTIELYYKNRASDNISYLNGNTYRLTNILDSIQVWNNGTIVRKYDFAYFKTSNIESPLLSEIVYYGLNNERLNSTIFKYSLSTTVDLVQQLYNETHQYISYKSKILSGDFNGDGKQDLLCIPNSTNGATWTTWKIYFSNGNNTFVFGYEFDPGTVLADLNDITVIDLNADGRDDILFDKKVISGSTRYSYFYYMLMYDTYSTYPPTLLYSVVSDQYTGFFEKLFRSNDKLKDKCGLNICDFNGDGVNDVFINGPGGAYKIFSKVNDGDFTELASQTINTFQDMILTGDFNGDGKTDVWNFENSSLKVYSLSGTSLSLIYENTSLNKNLSFVPGDFNGDGMLDLFINGSYNSETYQDYTTWQMWLSTGAGFTINNIPQLKANLYKDYLRVADFNGDGSTDLMLTSSDGSWSGTQFYMTTKEGTSFSQFTILAYPASTHQFVLGDFYGEGRSSFLCTDGVSPWWIGYQIYRSPGNAQDLLTEIRNGLGHYSKVTYVPLSSNSASAVYTKGAASTFPLYTFQGPLNVASKVESNNGIGGTLTTSYTYEGAKIHRQGKGFLGFAKVCGKNESTGIIAENNYTINTTYYYPQLTSSITRYLTTQNISTVTNIWTARSLAGGKRFIPYVSSSTATDNLTGFSTNTTTSAPDDYGNILSQSVAYTNGPTHSKTIVYNNDATNWLVSRPCSLTTTMSMTGNIDIVQLITTTYETGKIKPDIVKYFDGTTQKRQLNHDYNTNGTLSAFHEASTGLTEKHTSYSYDGNGINMVKIVSPEGIKDSAVYYPANGLINKTIDHWGNTTTYVYDNLGNISSSTKTNGIGISSNVLAFVNSPTYARYSATQTMSDGSQTVTYYDLLGREIQRGTKLFDGTVSCSQTDYNAKGQAYRVSEPFLSTGSASLWNTTTFDNYGRVSTITPSVGASSSYSYSGGVTTVTSNGRTYSTTTTNATGWPTSKTDPGGTISYSYKPDGNVMQITAPGSVNTYMTYDTYGNQLTLNDPSAGNTTYTYHGGGELSTQVTPKGTTTNYYLADGRLDYYTNPAGTYDYSYGTNKLVSGITSPGGVSRSYTYYANGKVDEISETIETGQTNKVKFVYDSYGRVSSKTYTNSNNVSQTESYVYNSYGYLDQIKFNGTVVYDATTMNTRGNITEASICGTQTNWAYNTYGQLTGNSAYYTQNYSYTPNPTTGNLTSRTRIGQSGQTTLTETFYYDNLDRLDSVRQGSTRTLLMGYDTKGNITTKSDAGTLVYDNGKPYQVAHVTSYNATNFPSVSQTATYTSFGKVNTLTEGNYTASFKYNADNERVKMVINQSGSAIKTKYYFGSSYEKVIEGGVTTEYIWIGGSPYTAVAVAKISGGTTTVYAIFRDHLGTITHLKSSGGTLEYSFDAYGRRRDKDTWSYTVDDTNALFADRGFTGHEHLTQFGLINMNGRLYDPLVGRFLSPDNYVQSPDFTQNFNRYGYCFNNPLRYTDEDGEWVHIVVGAVVGGVINLATNWNNLDNFGEGLASFGIGAATGALTAANPLLGATVGGAFSSAGNDIIRQTGNGFGLSDVKWGQVGGQAIMGATIGGLTYGAGQIVNQTGIANTILNSTGITNNSARNIVGSTINGTLIGTSSGLARGVASGVMTGEWNIWENIWKGAAFGGAGGLMYGSLTELGYQAQLKWGRNQSLNSKNTEQIAKGGQRYVNKLQSNDGSGSGDIFIEGKSAGSIDVILNTRTGVTSVYVNINAPAGCAQPPSPSIYSSPTIFQNILKLYK